MKNKKIFMRLLLLGVFLVFAISCDKNNDIDEGDITEHEYEEMTDSRDGKSYKTLQIGNQVWMAENLAYAPSSGNFWAYDNDNNNVETYGYLYDYQTALNVCPTGWHLPSDAEWTQMENFLADNGHNYDGTTGGGRNKIAKSLASTSGWDSSTITGAAGNTDYPTYRNKSGFTAFPGGYRNDFGAFYYIGDYGYWWSATEYDTDNAWFRHMDYYFSYVSRFNGDKELGFSVRCLMD